MPVCARVNVALNMNFWPYKLTITYCMCSCMYVFLLKNIEWQNHMKQALLNVWSTYIYIMYVRIQMYKSILCMWISVYSVCECLSVYMCVYTCESVLEPSFMVCLSIFSHHYITYSGS